MDWTKASVLVTGAASGMGRAIALAFAREGAFVCAADVNLGAAEATVDAALQVGGRALALEVDVARRFSVATMVERAIAACGRLDVLVNCAGVIGYMPALKLTEAEWDRVLDINLKGTFWCCQIVGAAMVASGTGGAIVNVSSISAELPEPDCVHYGVSKAGIAHLTKSLAVALAPHRIRVVALAPGTIRTPMNADVLDEPGFIEGRLKVIPLRRIGVPEDVAGAVLFLASDHAAYVTGSTLLVDGGTTLLR
ncbi:MAG: SDR family oxidoreductase [Methylobacteriaceae bacterium]|nr:SDR family oxidoreductase [Methylobacteriaceae bacterium]MBV9246154.1 SDR family oxidoreductase [Methylobacteriaceae bacterium]MBV9636924.1 SDR family oxidoreductase [Methylobacteriaceae bacterium]